MGPFLSLSLSLLLCSKPQSEGTNTTPTAMQLSEWQPQLSVAKAPSQTQPFLAAATTVVNAKPGVVSESSQALAI